ncbi:MAG: hypothetical protein H5T98_01025 [Syntrophomonadaceae bacterium]|nr:hypothetical protein [Syntrophomonadaceae bacterium]
MADTLQEFLVSLKYQQDEASQRRLLDGVKTTESKIGSFAKTSLKAAAALGAMGLVAAKGTLNYARSMEQLGFAANRTGTHIADLIALQKAAASFGSSAGGAQGSLEGVAGFIRNNPGSGAFLSSIGIKLKDNKGHARDTVAIMKDLAHAFQGMPQYQAKQYAEMLGIDENTELAMRQKGFGAALDKYRAAEGNSMDKAGAKGHAVMNQYRLAGAYIEGDKATAELTPMEILNKTLEKSNLLMADNNNWLNKLIGEFSVIAPPLAEVGAGMVALGLAKRLIYGGAAASAASGGLTAAEVAGVSWLGPLGALVGGLAYSPALNPTSSADGMDFPRKQSDIDAGKAALEKQKSADGMDFPRKQSDIDAGKAALEKQKTAANTYALRQKSRYAVARLMANGLTREQAVAMAASMQQESSFNPHAHNQGHLGLVQWDKTRQALFMKHMGFPLQAADVNDQLDFAAWEIKHRPEWKKMQANPHNLARLNEIVTRDYESPGNYGEEVPRRMGIAQNINTTINVRSTDPKLTAKEVEKAQAHVAQQLARNTAGAHR